MSRRKWLVSVGQVTVIVAASLIVIAVTYVVGQRLADSGQSFGRGSLDRRGSGNFETPFGAAAATLGVSEGALSDAAGFPPDYGAASAALNLSAAEVEAAFAAAGEFPEPLERLARPSGGFEGRAFNQSGLSLFGILGFTQTLMPITIIILAYILGQNLWIRWRRIADTKADRTAK